VTFIKSDKLRNKKTLEIMDKKNFAFDKTNFILLAVGGGLLS